MLILSPVSISKISVSGGLSGRNPFDASYAETNSIHRKRGGVNRAGEKKIIEEEIMRIRDGDKTEFEFRGKNIDIIADDNRPLFCIRLLEDGGIEISAGHICKQGDKMLDDIINIRPISSNRIILMRSLYDA